MRVLVAMSGGVDSSVAAALLLDAGHDVVGATMKLWGGASDSGCCSAADVQDARRAADELGIDHHVFNFTGEFDARVVAPYVDDHAAGRTPNPCVECNRHLKFGSFLARGRRLGFDAVATGHHARIRRDATGSVRLARAVDAAKDQSYVLSVLGAAELENVLLPVGELDKREVRAIAARRRLVTATKPDSQDVCFITAGATDDGPGGRAAFLAGRIPLHPGRVIDRSSGAVVGAVEAVELVTVGQRRGLATQGPRRHFALEVDVSARTVIVGDENELLVGSVRLERRTWVAAPLPPGSRCELQMSAHGRPVAARTSPDGAVFDVPSRRVAPGQLVACYVGDEVVGSGVAC